MPPEPRPFPHEAVRDLIAIARAIYAVETSVPAHAYPESVVMSFLDYFAFEAQNPTETAQRNFRTLARAGLRVFVYSALGYDPQRAVPAPWREFHDRMLLASSPMGFFSVFKETADFVLNAIRAGLRVDQHTVPDISVGKAWGEYWKSKDLARSYGERQKHDHNYPDYFAQAASNPQEIWVYPLAALGEFRLWLQAEYVPEKFPRYLETKVARGLLPPSVAELLLAEASASGDD
ncbi:MAG TPA: hypothetical protein VHC69_22195 [Polyangiaceae bacterium]|nr:hypothetical protein [Polyangiaceae bacterium]